jgi:hypothetical protein
MKFKNNEASFTLMFDGEEIIIPQGEFNVSKESLINFLIYQFDKWGKNVKIEDKKKVDQIEKVKESLILSEELEEEKEIEEEIKEAKEVIKKAKEVIKK